MLAYREKHVSILPRRNVFLLAIPIFAGRERAWEEKVDP